ncbi:MAG: glycoside hydrolase family 2 protein [candidate division KSB1 bacterium]|nr:glycoside hydrolase family 2 protein [candidate division KSB1 bacterium]
MNKRSLHAVLFLTLLCALCWRNGQNLALAQSPPQLFTPSIEINRQLQGKDIAAVDFYGLVPDEKDFTIHPSLRPGWTWLSAKNVRHKDKTISFFLHNGDLYCDETIVSNFRRRKAKKNVTELVQANTFHLAFLRGDGKDEEVLIFIATDTDKQVEVKIDRTLLGVEKRLRYQLAAGDAKLLRIALQSLRPEWEPLYVKPRHPLRQRINLNHDWKFHKGDVANAQAPNLNDANWEPVALPHSWNAGDIIDDRNFNDGLDIYTSYWRGISWYRKQFTVDQTCRGKKIFIEFEAANQVAEVWLNGVHLGQHIGGYLGFEFEVTSLIKFDRSNLLAVKVDNRFDYDIPPHTGDFNMMGGITREVWLKVTEKVHVVSTFVTTPEVSHHAATVKVVTEIKNDANHAKELRLVASVVNAEGFIVASMESHARVEKNALHTLTQQSGAIPQPRLWSPEEPNLYTVYSHLYDGETLVDEYASPLGFRWFEFDSQKGFFLNGKYLKLRGVNLHQDRFGYGPAVPDSLRVQDLRLFKKMGINFVRLAHYPHDPVMLQECDRLGILVWEEIPYVNTVGREKFIDNCKNMLAEMIARDRNHPAIIFWGIANETAEAWMPASEVPYIRKTLQALHDLAKALDTTRLTVQAQNNMVDYDLAGITDCIGFNRYFGWYRGAIEDFGKDIDELHQKYPHWKILISEYGADAKRGYHVENPERFDFSEDYQLRFHEGYLRQINERPWLGGSAVWNGCDFASEHKIGNIPRLNQKGLVDYRRRPKDAYYFYQSQWSQEPMVYIVSHTWRHRSGNNGEKKRIRILSNCDVVELFLNGQPLGAKEEDFVWEVAFHEGENELFARARKDEVTVSDRVKLYFEFATRTNNRK